MNDFKHKRKRAIILAAIGVVGIILVFTFKPDRTKFFRQNGIVWSTEYNIVYAADRDLSDSITATFRKVELSVSPFNKASRITAINNNETDQADSYLTTLYAASKKIAEETAGAFDPTVSPLINAWGFGYKNETQLPDSAAVDSLLKFVGIGKTRIDGSRIVKSDSRTTFNFSAIAKGFGCDEIGRMLERNGVTNYMIEIGGEITASGCNPKGGKWRISIDKPIAGTDSVVHNSAEIFAATDCGIATSGNYRNFKTDSAGHRYAHIIDPATGFPARSDILSATVIAPDCMTADAYATAFMVLGLEKSKVLLSRHPELAVMFIITEGDGQFGYWSNNAFDKLKITDRQ